MNTYTKLIDYINELCNSNPYDYLEKSSVWFSDSFVDINHKDCYPFYSTTYDNFFKSNKSFFQKDVGLKFIINKDIIDKDNDNDIYRISEWIIKTWGGIKGIQSSTIKELILNLSSTNYPYKNISSWSKLHSFKSIKENIIYDSRVIYSINWLILKLHLQEDLKFFHQPHSRNKKLTTFPMEPLINFYYSKSINLNLRGENIYNSVYYNYDESYLKFKNLINEINQLLWGQKEFDLNDLIGSSINLRDYPFFLEMLLFNISDDLILNDIRRHISISFD